MSVALGDGRERRGAAEIGSARGRCRSVDLAAEPADRADRVVAAEIDHEEARTAVGAAEQAIGVGWATTKASYRGGSTNGRSVK